MRHFSQLSPADRQRLFHIEPSAFGLDSDRQLLAAGLGATLYSPSIRPNLSGDVAKMTRLGLTSMVACLEDSIADHQVEEGEANLVKAVGELAQMRLRGEAENHPLFFIRVRRPDQIGDLIERCGEASSVIAGFVLPKFAGEEAHRYMEAVSQASQVAQRQILAMPILESPELIFAETRYDTLGEIRRIIDAYRHSVLAIRIGATDMSGTYGLRRSQEFTVYDIRVVAEAIGAIVNIFGRQGDDFVISGPVWEYFGHHERLFRPQLRQSLFAESDTDHLREDFLAADIDGLIKEVSLDHANGLLGKTVIHPTHVAPVHALSVVTMEQWTDASNTVQSGTTGGVSSSHYGNKMNEAKPHQGWAEKILRRAAVFGVAQEEVGVIDIISAGIS